MVHTKWGRNRVRGDDSGSPMHSRVVPIGTDNPWEQRTTKKGAAGGSDVSRGRAKVVAAYPRLLNTCDNIRIALPKGG